MDVPLNWRTCCGAGVDANATLSQGFDLHLNGWTLLLPEAAVLSIVRKYRANYLAIKESNPAYVGPWACQLLFERWTLHSCSAFLAMAVLAVLILMGYLGKLVLWVAAGGNFANALVRGQLSHTAALLRPGAAMPSFSAGLQPCHNSKRLCTCCRSLIPRGDSSVAHFRWRPMTRRWRRRRLCS